MNKIQTFIAAIAITTASVNTASAQHVSLWKNGVRIYQTSTADVDSITFTERESTPSADNLELSDLTGTWVITHSKGNRTEAGSIVKEWDEDTEAEFNCIVIRNVDQRAYISFLENSGKVWNEEGNGEIDIIDGKLVYKEGDYTYFNLLEYKDNTAVVEYGFEDSNRSKRYTDTMKRISKRTDVLRTESNTSPAQLETIPYLNYSDLTGTWQITNLKRLIESSGSSAPRKEEMSDLKDYIVFFPDGRYGYIEYSSSRDGWHLDGHEYRSYTVENGVLSIPGVMPLEYDKDGKAKAFFSFIDSKSSDEENGIITLKRVSDKTDYINYTE